MVTPIGHGRFFNEFVQEVKKSDYDPSKFFEKNKAEYEKLSAPENRAYYYRNDSFYDKENSSLLHRITSYGTLPSQWLYKNDIENIRTVFMKRLKNRTQDFNFVVKRISISVNGKALDVLLAGTRATIDNGRWILYSNPNAISYEEKFCESPVRDRMEKLQANSIFFNYPGVGGSEGTPTQQELVDAYKAVMKLLEDPEKGIGATEIISIGTSIGGGVQGEALKTYPLDPKIVHVSVFDQTFANLHKVPADIVKDFIGTDTAASYVSAVPIASIANKVLKGSKWTLNTTEAVKKNNYQVIVIQNTKVGVSKVKAVEDIASDGLLGPDSSLAGKLLQEKTAEAWGDKVSFVGVHSEHVRGYTVLEEERILKSVQNALDLERKRILKLSNEETTPS